MNCINCDEPIVDCERCGSGYIHEETQFHSCADKVHMAQAPQPVAETP